MKKVLATAMMISATGHVNQFDRGGKPYFLHCQKVAHYLKSDDCELMILIISSSDSSKNMVSGLNVSARF